MQPFRNSDKNKLLNFASGNRALGYGTHHARSATLSFHNSLSLVDSFFAVAAACVNRSLRVEGPRVASEQQCAKPTTQE